MSYWARAIFGYSSDPVPVLMQWAGKIVLSQVKKERAVFIDIEILEQENLDRLDGCRHSVLYMIESILKINNVHCWIIHANCRERLCCSTRMNFLDFCEMIGKLLDNNKGWTLDFNNYREETQNEKTIDETLRAKLDRRIYRLCHLTAVGDHTAWKHEVSGVGLMPEEAAKRIGINIGELVSNNVYSVYVPIGNLDKVLTGLDEWATQRGISCFRIQDELVLVETTKKD